MNKTIVEIVLAVSAMALGIFWGVSVANRNWREYLIEKNVAEWKVDKAGNTFFVIKPIKGERL